MEMKSVRNNSGVRKSVFIWFLILFSMELITTPLASADWQNIMIETFEGTFPFGLWSCFDGDGTTNGVFYWDDDDYKPYKGSWSAWCAKGGTNGIDPQL